MTTNIQYSNRDLTFPPVMANNGLILADDSVNWFCDTVEQQIFGADQKEPWRSEDRFLRLKSTSLNNRVGPVPIEFFDDFTGDHGSEHHGAIKTATDEAVKEAYRLRRGHLCYFFIPAICYNRDFLDRYPPGFHIVPIEDVVEIKGRTFAEVHAPVADIDPYLEAARHDEDPVAVAEHESDEATDASTAGEDPT